MIAMIWWFLVAMLDWRTIWRKVTGQLALDVVFISNLRDDKDRENLGNQRPAVGHFNGPRYWLGGISGRTRVLDITTDEMRGCKGRKKARKQFIAAVRWAGKNGAKVILLAAATKRLFINREELAELTAEFPKMIFTIGDNGTVLLLMRETLQALQAAGLKPGYSSVAVLGPYGFLGEIMTKNLKGLGYEIIGVGQNAGGLKHVAEEYGIATCQTLADIGKVDAVVACTHSQAVSLTAESVELIRRCDNRKLLVIDVAEPSNFRYKEYQKCKAVVVRQDAGNAYAPRLKYVLGAISYRLFRLSRGVTFGCFAEALSLASALKRGENVGDIDWLTVSDEKMEMMAKMFEYDGFQAPSPRCFGRSVRSFDLVLGKKAKNQATYNPAWKLIAQRLYNILF